MNHLALKEKFIKNYAVLFQDGPMTDPESLKAMGRSGAEAEVMNDQVNKRAIHKAVKAADWWLAEIASEKERLVEEIEKELNKYSAWVEGGAVFNYRKGLLKASEIIKSHE